MMNWFLQLNPSIQEGFIVGAVVLLIVCVVTLGRMWEAMFKTPPPVVVNQSPRDTIPDPDESDECEDDDATDALSMLARTCGVSDREIEDAATWKLVAIMAANRVRSERRRREGYIDLQVDAGPKDRYYIRQHESHSWLSAAGSVPLWTNNKEEALYFAEYDNAVKQIKNLREQGIWSYLERGTG